MMDHIEEWFYTHLAGIRNSGVAYDRIRLQPYVPHDLDYLSASVNTPHGPVLSEYRRRSDGSVSFHFIVPQGSTATILLPDGRHYEAPAGVYDYTAYP